MNVGISKNNYQNQQAATRQSLARVYMKDGRVQTLPLRQARPDYQFMNWFRHRSRALSGFPVSIRSILWIDNQGICTDCEQRVFDFLSRYRLGNSLRVVRPSLPNYAPQPIASCACNHARVEPYGFDEPFDLGFEEEIKDYSNYGGYNVTGKRQGKLTESQKNNIHANSQAQYYAHTKTNPDNFKKGLSFKGVEVNHRIPLERINQVAGMRNTPNKNNLQTIPEPVHAYVSKMWAYLKGKQSGADIKAYADGVDKLMQAKNKQQVETAIQDLKNTNPNLDEKKVLRDIISNGKSVFWTKEFLKRYPAWLSKAAVFGKELELVFQEMYAQEMGELAI